MIRVLDRHIARHVLSTTVVVLFVFVALISLFALVDELRGDLAFGDALRYVLLTTPRRIYELLPFVIFLGVLVALGNLASHSELIVFRTAGVSVSRLFLSICFPALLLIGVGVFFGEYVAPRMEETAEADKAKARYQSDAVLLSGSYWYREGGMYMNAEAVNEAGELLNVRQYWLDEAGVLRRTVQAESAFYSEADGAWVLVKVQETQLRDDHTRTEHYTERVWNGQVDPEMLSVRLLVEPPKLSIQALDQQIAYMDREGLNAVPYQLAYFSKLYMPLAVLGLCLLALAFVLGPMREVGIGVRLTIGVIAGLVFKYLQDLFAPLGQVYELHPALAVSIPVLACWLAALIGIRRFA